MRKVNWDSVVDNVQAGLVWFVIMIVATCTATLILFDIVVPAGGSMKYLTGGNDAVAIGISLATTGLLMSLMFVGYTMLSKKDNTTRSIGYFILTISFFVYCMDIAFDSLSADVFRYSAIVSIKDVDNSSVHIMFRALIGGISTVGEALAIAIIIGMPVLKTIINNAMPISHRSQVPVQVPNSRYNTEVIAQIRNGIPQPRQHPRSDTVNPSYHPITFHEGE